MNSKRDSTIYWAITGLWGVIQIVPGFMNFFVPMVAERFRALGYPQHLRIVLGFAEVFGVLALVLPRVPYRFKEAAYAGFLYLYVSAFIAHVAAGDGLGMALQPVLALAMVATSYFYFHRLNVVFSDRTSPLEGSAPATGKRTA